MCTHFGEIELNKLISVVHQTRGQVLYVWRFIWSIRVSPEGATEVSSNQNHGWMRLPWQLKSIFTVCGRPKVDDRRPRR